MKVFLLCGGYYTNFSYPKSFTKINGERLVDRTIRLLKIHNIEATVCCNQEETLFDCYHPLRCQFTFDYVSGSGYYLDIFAAVFCAEPCIYLFGDVYYTENAIEKIINRFNETDRNVFICNSYPFNKNRLRQGEPFGWIVKDQQEFQSAVILGKKFQDRGLVEHDRGIPSNWQLYHIINALNVNDFNLDKKNCLVIDDKTIDIDDPIFIEIVEKNINRE